MYNERKAWYVTVSQVPAWEPDHERYLLKDLFEFSEKNLTSEEIKKEA